MPNSIPDILLLHCFLLLFFFQYSAADIGIALSYSPPYAPTACYGNDPGQFPTSNLFAAAGEGIWDNGAACGRQYLVRCISGVGNRVQCAGGTIQVRIVDRALIAVSGFPTGSSLALSNTAFQTISSPPAPISPSPSLNVEFQQL